METAPALRVVELDERAVRAPGEPVVLDVWCDLACPDCAAGLDVLAALRDRFGDALFIEFRHFPLVGHIWAVAAAQVLEAAKAAGVGGVFATRALESIDEIDWADDYLDIAASFGLDRDELVVALMTGEHAGAVHLEAARGRELGVQGTPTFVVDGLLVDAGKTLDGALDVLTDRIARALK